MPPPREMFTTAVISYVLLILIAFQNVETTVIFGRDGRAALISSVLQQTYFTLYHAGLLLFFANSPGSREGKEGS